MQLSGPLITYQSHDHWPHFLPIPVSDTRGERAKIYGTDMKWTLQLANEGSKIVSFSLRGCYCCTEYMMDMTGKTLESPQFLQNL